MAEQQSRRESSPRLRPGSGPPQPGWKVTPAPDGRGSAPAKPPRGPNPRWLAVGLIVALLALNFWVSSQVLGPNPRVRIPYSPTFLQQVDEKNVSSISSTGNSIEGTLKKAIKYPADSSSAPTTPYFSTQIPSFANGTELFNTLTKNNVTINANPTNTGPSFLASLIFGFGPTLLFLLLLVWIFRRAAAGGGGAGGLMSFGRSRPGASRGPTSTSRSTMWPGSTRRGTS